MFFLLVIIISLSIIIPVCTTIKIELKNIKIQIDEKTKKIINKDYTIILTFYFLNKVKYFKTLINSKKLQNKKIDLYKMNKVLSKNNFKIKNKKILEIIKLLRIQVKKINLNIKIGTEDAALTAIIIGTIAIIIGTFLNMISKEKNEWKLEPIYQNKNILKIDINSIFNIKMIHIIYTIYHLKMKGEIYGRTSDRRSYAYSNE